MNDMYLHVSRQCMTHQHPPKTRPYQVDQCDGSDTCDNGDYGDFGLLGAGHRKCSIGHLLS